MSIPHFQINLELSHQLVTVMTTIFGDSEDLLMVDYLHSKKTIIGQYYAKITFKLYDIISQKHLGKLWLSVWHLHDNAPVHKSLVAQQAVHDCEFLHLNLPAYSPDLAPNDCYLFRNLKSHLLSTQFADNKSPTVVVKTWFEGQNREFFFQGINSLAEKWQKWTDVAGHYNWKRHWLWLKVCGYSLYRSCKTFWSPSIHTSPHYQLIPTVHWTKMDSLGIPASD